MLFCLEQDDCQTKKEAVKLNVSLYDQNMPQSQITDQPTTAS